MLYFCILNSLMCLTFCNSLCRYIAEQVPFAKVDVEAGVKAKFNNLVGGSSHFSDEPCDGAKA